MKFRFSQIKVALFAAIVLLTPLSAQAAQPFTQAAFSQAQEAGKSILVDVSAPWCPTCAKQAPIIQGLESAHPDLVVFEVDFDSAKDVLRQFKVQYQSTLISFKGKAEVARSTGESNPDAIAAQVAKSF
ncbi:MAG: thiol reductase thioredoxin [Alphaproteobacteria bacterium RIFOXYD12_FULL_60_8]|nr:MAG: thiol reductase thioredoxin [Alphaproteobacteria bacterium RIFOXYD12_FULL_60_8]